MLLRGIYTFEPRPEDHNHTLPFTCNDTLIFLEVLKRDANWIKVADIYGRVGYVPKIFVEPFEDYENPDLILTFFADAVVKARQNDLHSAIPLEMLRDEIRENPSTVHTRSKKMMKVFEGQWDESEGVARRSKSDHQLRKMNRKSDEKLLRTGSTESIHTQNPRRYEAKSSRRNSGNNQFKDYYYNSDFSVKTAKEDEEEEEEAGNRRPEAMSSTSIQKIKTNLVNVIQETSGLGPRVSENLLNEVFQCIKESSTKVPVDSFIQRLSSTPSEEEGSLGELTRIMRYMSKLSREGIKQGGRHRKTPLPSQTELEKLRKLLIECDPLKVKQKLELGRHSFSQEFVHLYHLESPEVIKERILDIFLIICSLDKKGRAMLVSTKLPIYLARELMAAKAGTKIFDQVVDLLTTLLSCGETMPDTHFQILGSGFINYLMREVEDTFAKSCENEFHKICSPFPALIKLILAYNLQFSHGTKENIVLKVIAERWKRPRGFVTVMIQLFQKASDPLHFEREEDFGKAPHSVFKMITDICLCQKTSTHFSEEDSTALSNSIIDGLCDNPAGRIRIGYLRVLRALLGNTQKSLKDTRTALLSILLDTDPLAIPEQQLIRNMSKEYPRLFLRSISRIKTNVESACEFKEDEDNSSYLSS